AAIAAYLKTLPAVRNQVPLPLHYGFVETVLRKLTYPWPALIPERLTYSAGNFGNAGAAGMSRDLPQRILIWAQLILLALGAAAYLCAPRRVRADGPLRGLSIIVSILVLVVAGAAVVIYHYPALDRLPTQAVVTGFSASIPPAKTETLPPHQAALLQRGRYL